MIIIGEKINATRKAVAAALEARDSGFIAQTAIEQVKSGANYLDVNGGDAREGQEERNMAWLIDVVQTHTDAPIAIDTADPVAAETGLSMVRTKPILNSISLESARLESLLPLATGHECMVVALLMSDQGPPTGVEDRLAVADQLIGKLTGAGKAMSDIIVDPCFFPVSSDHVGGEKVMRAIAEIHRCWPEVHIGGGVSNISYGLPKRRNVNLAALCQAIFAGMDVGIIDPTIPGIIPMMLAAEVIAGRDEYCMNYVTAEREGRLG